MRSSSELEGVGDYPPCSSGTETVAFMCFGCFEYVCATGSEHEIIEFCTSYGDRRSIPHAFHGLLHRFGSLCWYDLEVEWDVAVTVSRHNSGVDVSFAEIVKSEARFLGLFPARK